MKNRTIFFRIAAVFFLISTVIYFSGKADLCPPEEFKIDLIQSYNSWKVVQKNGKVMNCDFRIAYSILITDNVDIKKIYVTHFDYERYREGEIIK